MPTFGGLSPFPLRFGGGKTRLQSILEGLNADRGTAFDASNSDTVVYAEDMAIARSITAAWGTNARLGSLWDADRMSGDILARWEGILALAPLASDSLFTRRQRVALHLSAVGQPSISAFLSATLSSVLGAAFVALEYISYAHATILVPDGTYPWGTTGDTPWSSTVAQVLVHLQKPAGWSENDFYTAAAKVGPIMDPALPAWATFTWYRGGASSYSVSGGPSAGGFFLDQLANLDNQVLGQ